ncbi:MAG TPA: hypothetical protein PLU56_01080 [Sphingorhabdus lacus]|jgi:hypothetical protein|nr:hypothetical protein [Sphingorhabdus lacus]
MKKSLPRNAHAATQHLMRGRFTSLLVLIGLFFGIVVMPALAHANDHSSVHASEMLDVHEVGPEIEDADHSQPASGDSDMPCHAVSHHHCSIALQLDAPRINLSGLAKALLIAPSATTPLLSRSQAPPLDPPNA